MTIVMKNPNQICCDGVNIAILVWKGNKFVDKKVASVCFFAYRQHDLELFVIKPLI